MEKMIKAEEKISKSKTNKARNQSEIEFRNTKGR